MEKHELNKEDPLKKYFDPERIERAPEGFSEKTMARIMAERQGVIHQTGIFSRNRVPLISVLITLLLIIIAIIIPADQTNSIFGNLLKTLASFKLSMPEINVLKGSSFNLPGWALYGFVAIVLIGLVDRGLFQIFHKTGGGSD